MPTAAEASCGGTSSSSSTSKVQVEYVDFEDGHRPGNTSEKTRLALNLNKQSTRFLSVFDDLLDRIWCDRAYNYALSRNGKPFGVYIQTTDALDPALSAEELWAAKDYQRALALVTTRALVFERAHGALKDDIEAIHGTAVWCLSSGVSNSVQYHIDYAELYRYETNVIHPPLYAGTCQVSPIGRGEMSGGSFCANMQGLKHYQRFGYKGKIAVAQAEAQAHAHAHAQASNEAAPAAPASPAPVLTSEAVLLQDMQQDSAWQEIRYKCNRGILHDGDLPHLSTPITHIVPGKRRVIFGFNCFTEEVGACCIRAPEHSDAFNRTVKLYQAMSGLSVAGKYAPEADSSAASSSSSSRSGSGCADFTAAAPALTLAPAPAERIQKKDVMKNPALAKLLVLAARKVKEHKAATGEDFVTEARRVTQGRDAAATAGSTGGGGSGGGGGKSSNGSSNGSVTAAAALQPPPPPPAPLAARPVPAEPTDSAVSAESPQHEHPLYCYHPGQCSSSDSDEWQCCFEIGRSWPGCTTSSAVKHHPSWGYMADYAYRYTCCDNANDDGCTLGPHPSPYV